MKFYINVYDGYYDDHCYLHTTKESAKAAAGHEESGYFFTRIYEAATDLKKCEWLHIYKYLSDNVEKALRCSVDRYASTDSSQKIPVVFLKKLKLDVAECPNCEEAKE